MSENAGVLFSAFEPSGDAIAAPVIAALRARRPDLRVWALGGPRMKDAGAELIEATTEQAAMLVGAAAHYASHRARLHRLASWLGGSRLRALVPVDSPAANWSICRAVRRSHRDARIVHLVAPQLWAWGPWRIGKLRRLTDHLLCVLPFEPMWFGERGVPATFVGHPLYEPGPDPCTAGCSDDGSTVLAILPGSRPAEIRANLPMMLEVYRRLCRTRADLAGAIAAASASTADLIRQVAGPHGLPPRLALHVGRTASVLAGADVALVKSGTATLSAAAGMAPMVVVYNYRRWSWHLVGRWLVRTRTFTLPNLIAEHLGLGRIVPEFVPHFGRIDPVLAAVAGLLDDPAARSRQREDLTRVAAAYRGCAFAARAADLILPATS